MKATQRQPLRTAASAIASGEARSCSAVELARLGDVPVLAELAGEVAAGRAEGQHRRARQEMVERLLLDRVDAEAGRAAVGGQHDLVVLAGAHEAQTALALVQLALARAQVALDAPVLEPVPVAAGPALHDLLVHSPRPNFDDI